MGLLSKIVAANLTSRVVKRLNQAGQDRRAATPVAPGPRQTYIPANAATGGVGALRDRAVQVYRDNPKMVAGAGVLLAAAALQALTRRR